MIVVDEYNVKCGYPDCSRPSQCIIATPDGRQLQVCRQCRKIVILNLEKYNSLIRPGYGANIRSIQRPNSKSTQSQPLHSNMKNQDNASKWLKDAVTAADNLAKPLDEFVTIQKSRTKNK